MVEGIFIAGTDGLEHTSDLRYNVFTKELGMPAELEKDLYDNFAHHLVVNEGDVMVATGRLIFKENEFLIGRIAVDKDARGKNYGDLVVRMLVDRAFRMGADDVVVHSLLLAQDFYKTIGFKVQGEPFNECDLQHVKMVINDDAFNEGGCSSCSSCDGC